MTKTTNTGPAYKRRRGRSLWPAVALLVVLAQAPVAALAQAEGDPEAGAIKAYTCTGCHGIPGYNNVYPTYHVPKLGGQHYEYIVAALKAYRDGQRDHQTMTAQAASLSDQDIMDIAAYLARLSKSSGRSDGSDAGE